MKKIVILGLLFLFLISFVSSDSKCASDVKCNLCSGNTPKEFNIKFEGVKYCGSDLPAVINKDYKISQTPDTIPTFPDECFYEHLWDEDGIYMSSNFYNSNFQITISSNGASYQNEDTTYFRGKFPQDSCTAGMTIENTYTKDDCDTEHIGLYGGKAIISSCCEGVCTRENLVKTLKIKVGDDEINVTDPSVGVGTGYYSGRKKKFVGSVSASLNYIYSPDKTTLLIEIEGSLFSSTKYYYFEKAGCHIRGGTYTAKEYDFSSKTYVKNGDTISFQIVDNPCPGKCEKNSDCWEDPNIEEGCTICNQQKEICEIKRLTEGCKICSGFRQATFLPSGSYCITSDSKKGNCEKSDKEGETLCVANSCEKIYGSDYKNCPETMPEGKTRCSEDCCAPGDNCCHENKKASPICCDPNNYKCGMISNPVKEANYCNPIKCPSDRPVFCNGSTPELSNPISANWCCKADEKCSLQKVFGSNYMPICVKKDNAQCNEDLGETECRKVDGGVLCCRSDEECVDIGETSIIFGHLPVKVCLKKTCESPKFICSAIGATAGKMRICCDSGNICTHSSNGFPRCIAKPTKINIQNGMSNTLTGESDKISAVIDENEVTMISTLLPGFFALRNSESLSENGEAFHVYSNSGELESPVIFDSEKPVPDFEESVPNNLEIYYYEEGSINDCITDVISSQEISSGVYLDKVTIQCSDVIDNQLANLAEASSMFNFPDEDRTKALKEAFYYYKINLLSLEKALKLIKEIVNQLWIVAL